MCIRDRARIGAQGEVVQALVGACRHRLQLAAEAVDAPAVRFATGNAGTELTLIRPITARPSNGGLLTLSLIHI